MDTHDYELRVRIEEVSSATADEDALITIAIPPDKPVGEILERVEEDHAEAEYIDSDGESRGVMQALERARHALHGYDRTPENGLAVYVGVVDGDLVEYVFDDLPGPVREFVYERANEFDVEPLADLARPSAEYGLLVVERGGAALGRLAGDRVELIEEFDSQVMGKSRAGGQSAQRFERERERQKHEFFETVAEEAERAFLGPDATAGSSGDAGDSAGGDSETASDAGVDGLLLGGTEVTVEEFRTDDYLDHRLRDAIVGGPVAVEYASEQGLRQLAEKSRERLDEAETRPAREALDRFFEAIREREDEVVYGEDDVEEALSYDAVDTVLVSDGLPAEEVREIADRAAEEGGESIVVPTEIERGRQFHESFGGVAALLRFPIE